MHVARERRSEQDAVRDADRARVDRLRRVGCLPENLPRLHVQGRPRTAGGGTAINQRIGFVIPVRNRRVDSLAVRRGSPFDAAQRRSWTNHGVPDEMAVLRAKRPIHSAFLPEPDHVTDQIWTRAAEVIIGTARLRTRHWIRILNTCNGPHVLTLEPPGPLDGAVVQMQRHHAVEMIVGGETGRWVTGRWFGCVL